jgi:hypothetical protein
MAARQDQTLQIFMIVFIFLFLVTAVVAYLGWRGYSDAEQRAAALQVQVNDKNTQTNNQQVELEDLREVMGFGRNDSTADVKKTAATDLATYGPGLDEASRTYRKVLETVHAEGQQTAAREAKLKETLAARDKELLAVQAQAKAQIDKFDEARKTAEADAAAQKNSFAEFRTKLEKSQAELQKNLDDQHAKYEAQIAERDAKIKSMEELIPKLEHQIRNLNEQRKDEPGSFEVADGRISRVNQNGTVWINLGAADSLRRQVSFMVYDADQHDAAKAVRKGSIEVTMIMGDHMAEAKITEDDALNPILTGDKIYSQVWHRGKKLRFALTGVIDFDGDGQSDLELARDLIDLNGGTVDAYLKEDGKVEGQITANTRYLVLGDFPETAGKVALQQGWQEMNKTAASLGVETITITDFLSQMGHKPQDRTVRLGSGASARDFPARPESANTPGDGGPRFRSRPTPPQPSGTAP